MSGEDYIKGKKLGSGAFGDVYQVHKGRTTYAMKQIKEITNLESQMQELTALEILKGHPNIVEFVEYYFTQTNLCIVTEFCNGGNLGDYVIEEKRSDRVLFALMKQMADAIQYSHRNRIVHRDLKPENVLITKNNGRTIAKIADFGLAKIKLSSIVSFPSSGLPLISYMYTEAGTLFYMAPEVFKERYTEKVDVFSLGVMFCAILERPIIYVQGHGKYLGILFSDVVQEPIGMVLRKFPDAVRQLDPNVAISKECKNLIESMIIARHDLRPSAEDVYKALNQEFEEDDNAPKSYPYTSIQFAYNVDEESESESDSCACCCIL